MFEVTPRIVEWVSRWPDSTSAPRARRERVAGRCWRSWQQVSLGFLFDTTATKPHRFPTSTLHRPAALSGMHRGSVPDGRLICKLAALLKSSPVGTFLRGCSQPSSHVSSTLKLAEALVSGWANLGTCCLPAVNKFYILEFKPGSAIGPISNHDFPAVCFSYPLDNG